MKIAGSIITSVFGICLLAGCQPGGASLDAPETQVSTEPPATAAADLAAPVITHIVPSADHFTISDCAITSVTVTADISDNAGVVAPTLWYRLQEKTYTPLPMQAAGGGQYSVTVKGVDLPRNDYGVWEFYLTATDPQGHESKSEPNQSVQFLPCAAR